jgi:hypothetical protein
MYIGTVVLTEQSYKVQKTMIIVDFMVTKYCISYIVILSKKK